MHAGCSDHLSMQQDPPSLGAPFHFQSRGRLCRHEPARPEPSAAVGGKPIKAFSAMQDSVQLMTAAKFLMRNENASILEL